MCDSAPVDGAISNLLRELEGLRARVEELEERLDALEER